jgi:hypothetical protein
VLPPHAGTEAATLVTAPGDARKVLAAAVVNTEQAGGQPVVRAAGWPGTPSRAR